MLSFIVKIKELEGRMKTIEKIIEVAIRKPDCLEKSETLPFPRDLSVRGSRSMQLIEKQHWLVDLISRRGSTKTVCKI